jgi:hypothetical protein
MENQMTHLFAASDFCYHQNFASCFEIVGISGRKTRVLGNRVLRFKDMEHQRWPNDAPH